jgi:ubiquinone/menaquinone biosynthesis C-methylase UbiE
MLKIDFGSGYNPKEGYKTCDITKAPYLNYYYDIKSNEIIGLKESTVDKFHLRNVIHHIEDIDVVLNKLHTYLKTDGIVEIIECRKEHYKSNFFLDRLWYRFIIPRNEIWFSETYRDYTKVLNQLGFTLIHKEYINEKEVSLWKKLDNN